MYQDIVMYGMKDSIGIERKAENAKQTDVKNDSCRSVFAYVCFFITSHDILIDVAEIRNCSIASQEIIWCKIT